MDIVLKQDEEIFLTKNGYGSMVLLSIEKYSELMEEIEEQKSIDAFGNSGNEIILNPQELDDTNYMEDEEVITKPKYKKEKIQ